MTFQTEQNLIFTFMLATAIILSLGYCGLSVYKARKATTANDRAYYLLAVGLSALVAAFMGFHLSQVIIRF